MRRAINLYLFAIREHANEALLEEIEDALEAPNVFDTVTGRPAWYSSDEEAWREWES